MIEESRILAIARAVVSKGGVYVEAGANDGIRQSNTLALKEALGWSGILVEPSPKAFAALVRNQPGDNLVNAALVGHGGTDPMFRGPSRIVTSLGFWTLRFSQELATPQ